MAGSEDEKRAWIALVLGIELPGGEGVPTAPPLNAAAAGTRGDVAEQLKIVNEDMRLYGLTKELGGPLRAAAEAVKAGDAGAAHLLDALQQQIAEAAQRKRTDGVRDTIKAAGISAQTGVVAFAKMRLHLQKTRSSYSLARENLHSACAALLTTPDFVDDPRSTDPKTLAAIAQVGDRVPPIDELSDAVDDAIDAMVSQTDTDARDAAKQAAVTAIAKYRAALDADPILLRMQNTAAGSFPIRDELAGAIETLHGALTA